MTTLGSIYVHLDTLDQLVEPFPPSPFPKPRLRKEAEDFIVDHATHLPRASTVKLIVRLPESAAVDKLHVMAVVHQHFAFRRDEAEKKLSRTRQMGWKSLLISVVFLSVTIPLVEMMKRYLPTGNVFSVIEGGLTILAWVALWRPAELLLYDWYPFHFDARLFSKLERAEIEVISHS